MRKLRAVLRLAVFAFLCLVVIPLQGSILLLTKGPASYRIPRLWHGAVRRVFGIRVEIEGRPFRSRQCLYMSNHISYLDIPVMGSVLECAFVAKSEVENWPLFGFLSKLQQTAFINRRRSAIRNEKNSLQGRIGAGESLIIFPEGTSTDGQGVLPFKSSLFSLALAGENRDLHIQPVTIRVMEVDGRPPLTQQERDLYAWHIGMDTPLAPHLWRFAQGRGARIRLVFHEPLPARAYTDRKVLAKTCHDNVSRGLHAALAA